jgi:hypothetical protein
MILYNCENSRWHSPSSGFLFPFNQPSAFRTFPRAVVLGGAVVLTTTLSMATAAIVDAENLVEDAELDRQLHPAASPLLVVDDVSARRVQYIVVSFYVVLVRLYSSARVLYYYVVSSWLTNGLTFRISSLFLFTCYIIVSTPVYVVETTSPEGVCSIVLRTPTVHHQTASVYRIFVILLVVVMELSHLMVNLAKPAIPVLTMHIATAEDFAYLIRIRRRIISAGLPTVTVTLPNIATVLQTARLTRS